MTLRQRVPDPAKAKSLMQAAERDMKFVLALPVSLDSGQTIVSRIYENFRALGDAHLLLQGKETYGEGHHREMIESLFDLNTNTERSIRVLINLKNLRKNVNYNGYIPTIAEIEDSRDIAKQLFKALIAAIKTRFKKYFL